MLASYLMHIQCCYVAIALFHHMGFVHGNSSLVQLLHGVSYRQRDDVSRRDAA